MITEKLYRLKRGFKDKSNNLKNWYSYNIFAKTTKDFEMDVWNGCHPVEENTSKHVCKSGTKVRVWMISRFGDVGITDNLENPTGYDTRGVNPETDLIDYEFIDIG